MADPKFLVTYEYQNIFSDWQLGAAEFTSFEDAEAWVSESYRNVEFFERRGDTWVKLELPK